MRAKGGDWVEERVKFMRPGSLGRQLMGGTSQDTYTGFRTFRPSRQESTPTHEQQHQPK